ncbi:MAG: hypothetical protein ACTHXJ_04170, partial [Mesonia sp.]
IAFLLLGIVFTFASCEPENDTLTNLEQDNFDLAVHEFQKKMENIDSISEGKIMPYLIKNSKELIRESNLSQQEKSKY